MIISSHIYYAKILKLMPICIIIIYENRYECKFVCLFIRLSHRKEILLKIKLMINPKKYAHLILDSGIKSPGATNNRETHSIL